MKEVNEKKRNENVERRRGRKLKGEHSCGDKRKRGGISQKRGEGRRETG